MSRTLLICILSLFTIAPHFGRAEEPAVDAWFAEYDELMEMSDADRKAYLEEVRNIVVGYEENTHQSLAPYRSAMSEWTSWLPEAEAAAPASSGSASVCPRKDDRRQRIGSDQFCLVNDRPSAKGECPDGTDLVAHTNGGRGFTAYRDLCYSKRESAEGGIELICGKGLATSCLTNPKSGKVECQCLSDGTKPKAPVKVARADAAPEKPASPAKATDAKATDAKAPTKTAAKETPKPETKPEAAPVPKPACHAAVPKCEGGDPKKVRDEFYLQKRACVYAGNISKYRRKKPAKGDCEPTTTVTLGEKHTYACTEGVLCNPLVFCVPKIEGSQGYCSKNRGSSTTRCDSIAPKNPECLNKLVKSIPREAWNGFLKQFKQVCATDKPSAAYHCQECSIMSRRIFALNSQYLRSVCKGSPAATKDAKPTSPVETSH